ncbi:hypothetical protein AVEN_155633-1 [Araneus ventricosus]|uniref:Uncharacterized protein n=1 Tax=Araneus ventricosus TaxID=182803 RepID=A0A4Y2UUW9_ARAVE|nr:hypothetical protein AVEN_155633-1 [Araneus ventricosus]
MANCVLGLHTGRIFGGIGSQNHDPTIPKQEPLTPGHHDPRAYRDERKKDTTECCCSKLSKSYLPVEISKVRPYETKTSLLN